MATAFCPGEDAKPQQIERIARRCTTENLRKSARKDSCTVLTAPGQAQACTPNSGESSTPNNWESDSVEVTLEKEGEPDERRCSDDKSSRWNCDGIAVITMGSARRIYFDAEMGDALTEALDGFAGDANVRVVVVTGGAPGYFI